MMNTGVRWPSAARKPMRMPSGIPSTTRPRKSEYATSLALLRAWSSESSSGSSFTWSLVRSQDFIRSCMRLLSRALSEFAFFRRKFRRNICFTARRSFFQCILALFLAWSSLISLRLATTPRWTRGPASKCLIRGWLAMGLDTRPPWKLERDLTSIDFALLKPRAGSDCGTVGALSSEFAMELYDVTLLTAASSSASSISCSA
mmetsp:Transcript_20852/g.62127  ORF Transcript_20852/g.62127 Transcript_20852/m.62127 type:complete len:203 (+) Transcript_20852:452-1060(+)